MGRIRLNTEKITKLGLIALAISLFVLMLRGCAIARGGYEGDSDAPTADGDDATVSIYNADTDKVYSLPLEEYVLRVTAAEMPASFAGGGAEGAVRCCAHIYRPKDGLSRRQTMRQGRRGRMHGQHLLPGIPHAGGASRKVGQLSGHVLR